MSSVKFHCDEKAVMFLEIKKTRRDAALQKPYHVLSCHEKTKSVGQPFSFPTCCNMKTITTFFKFWPEQLNQDTGCALSVRARDAIG